MIDSHIQFELCYGNVSRSSLLRFTILIGLHYGLHRIHHGHVFQLFKGGTHLWYRGAQSTADYDLDLQAGGGWVVGY